MRVSSCLHSGTENYEHLFRLRFLFEVDDSYPHRFEHADRVKKGARALFGRAILINLFLIFVCHLTSVNQTHRHRRC